MINLTSLDFLSKLIPAPARILSCNLFSAAYSMKTTFNKTTNSINHMKTIYTFLILVLSLNLFQQSNAVVGKYHLKLETVDANVFEYELTLSPDGPFLFHYYSTIKQGFPPEIHKYGKGKWSVEKNVVSFFSDTDNEEKYTLNFSNSKARFITKSPRDKTDKVVKTALQFLQSDIFWIKPIKLIQVNQLIENSQRQQTTLSTDSVSKKIAISKFLAVEASIFNFTYDAFLNLFILCQQLPYRNDQIPSYSTLNSIIIMLTIQQY